MIGAYKTPSLRALPRTAPYFHNGMAFGPDALFFAVLEHVKKRPDSPYLDPEIRPVVLNEDAMRALVVFLKALDGDPIPAVLKE
jgi:cytochrome c peroxidase